MSVHSSLPPCDRASVAILLARPSPIQETRSLSLMGELLVSSYRSRTSNLWCRGDHHGIYSAPAAPQVKSPVRHVMRVHTDLIRKDLPRGRDVPFGSSGQNPHLASNTARSARWIVGRPGPQARAGTASGGPSAGSRSRPRRSAGFQSRRGDRCCGPQFAPRPVGGMSLTVRRITPSWRQLQP